MDAEKLARKARKSISSYCYEECSSYCCRKGYLVITKKEAVRVTQNRTKELAERGFIKELADGRLSMNMTALGGCPSLKEFKCTIHKSKLRPEACQRFPLFIEGDRIRLSRRCMAVREGKLYPFIRKFKEMGYKIYEDEDFSDLDQYNSF